MNSTKLSFFRILQVTRVLLVSGCVHASVASAQVPAPNAPAEATLSPLPASTFTQSPLPKPSGIYPVGYSQTIFVDRTRIDTLYPDETPSSQKRTQRPRYLPVHFWYPALSTRLPKRPYVTRVREAEILEDYGLTDAVGISSAIPTNSVADAPMARGLFPLLLLSPGFGVAAELYQTYAEELASQGYIVVAVHSPGVNGPISINGETYASLPDVPTDYAQSVALNDYVVQDLRSVLRLIKQGAPNLRFRNAIDFTKVGAFGHSYGGSASVRLAVKTTEVRAAVDLDGSIWGNDLAGLRTSTLFVRSLDNQDPTVVRAYEGMRGRSYLCDQKDTRHSTFSDLYYLLRALNGTAVDTTSEELGTRPAANLLLTRRLLVQFFNTELRGQSRALLFNFLTANRWTEAKPGFETRSKY